MISHSAQQDIRSMMAHPSEQSAGFGANPEASDTQLSAQRNELARREPGAARATTSRLRTRHHDKKHRQITLDWGSGMGSGSAPAADRLAGSWFGPVVGCRVPLLSQLGLLI